MKNKHVPAGFGDKPCLAKQIGKNGKPTGFRCTKIEGHKDEHASIGVGTLFSDNRIDIAGMSEKKAMEYMVTLKPNAGTLYAAWS